MSEVSQNGDHSPQMTMNDRTGLYLAILAFGISLLAADRSYNAPAIADAKIDTIKIQIEAQFKAQIATQDAKLEELNHRVEVAENHWRNGDTAIMNLQSSVRKLETEHARH